MFEIDVSECHSEHLQEHKHHYHHFHNNFRHMHEYHHVHQLEGEMSDEHQPIDEKYLSASETPRRDGETRELNVIHCSMFSLKEVPVLKGSEPPLPHLATSASISEAIVRGSADCRDRTAACLTEFAVAWPDGRICICIVTTSEKREGVNGEALLAEWRTMRCVHTGLLLFRLEYVSLEANHQLPVFVAAARSGQTFFVSSYDVLEDDASHRYQMRDTMPFESIQGEMPLPATVCCFECDSLISGKQGSDKCEGLISSAFGLDHKLLLHDFTIRKFVLSFLILSQYE